MRNVVADLISSLLKRIIAPDFGLLDDGLRSTARATSVTLRRSFAIDLQLRTGQNLMSFDTITVPCLQIIDGNSVAISDLVQRLAAPHLVCLETGCRRRDSTLVGL